MVGSRKVGGRRAALGAVAAWLALTTPSVAAPPTISGADGDAWNSAPTYVVTGGEWGVAWNWQSTSGQAALSTASPFQVIRMAQSTVEIRTTQGPNLGVCP